MLVGIIPNPYEWKWGTGVPRYKRKKQEYSSRIFYREAVLPLCVMESVEKLAFIRP